MNVHEKSRYHEVYARSLRDPEGFWAEAAQEIDWIEPPKKMFDPAAGAYGRWFPGAVVNTCYNALDRHVAGGRADQVALIHDSPLTNTRHEIHLCRDAQRGEDARRRHAGLRRRQGRPRHHLYADGAGGGGRDAGLRAHRRGAFGGVRRLCRQGTRDPHRRRRAKADLLRELRHRARPHRAIQAAARRGDRACERQAAGLHHPAAAAADLRVTAGRDHDWAELRAKAIAAKKARRLRAGARRPIRSTFSTPPAPPACRRAWCATMAAIWSR